MKRIIAMLWMLAKGTFSLACTTFLLSKNGHHVFGRNYDWVTGNGMVMVNAKGVAKRALKIADGQALSWQSVYGSITFNQYGKEFPTGGMNEKGLVVELMWLDETSYPRADPRPALRELQWIQYQLDCSASVKEVIESDKKLRIAENSVPLHFLIADAEGNAASIEFLNGTMVVHRDKALPIPVLSNSVYETVAKKADANGQAVDGAGSEQRFARACRLVQRYRENDIQLPPVNYAFSILENVSQGDFTKWSIVYDITAREVHFFTEQHRPHKRFSFRDFNFACDQVPAAFNMNSEASGDVAGLFSPLTVEQNRQLVEMSAEQSRKAVAISPESIAETTRAYTGKACR
jgi:choloylglycine hydrolase